mmetsp:Transcript_68530/g.142876  ORF Transcript_68530/g.142876 Transcript_68530/m.142876 type:complete len:348 (+) Transcript_68530:291-1334(+)
MLLEEQQLLPQQLLVAVDLKHVVVQFVFLPLHLPHHCPCLFKREGKLLPLRVQLLRLLLVLHYLALHIVDAAGEVRHHALQLCLRPPHRLGLLLLELAPDANGVALENGALHVHHQLLLPPHQLRVPELHAMDLALHPFSDLGALVLVRVCRLRLLLHLNLALKGHDLALALKQVFLHHLLLLQRRLDLGLEADGLLFQIFERVGEIRLQREIISLQRGKLALVAADELVEFGHVGVHALDRALQLRHLFVLHAHLAFDADALLSEDGGLRLDLSHALRLLRRLVRQLHQLRLGAHPHALEVVANAPLLVDFVAQRLDRRLQGAHNGRICASLGLELRPQRFVLPIQ